MLKPGWYPAIPGWHLDAIPRDANNVPDLDHPQCRLMKHWLYTLDSGTGALTAVCNAEASIMKTFKPAEGETLWGRHSAVIAKAIKNRSVRQTLLASDDLTCIPHDCYHTSTAATGSGWRFFFRASENTLHSGPHNEIRKQVQVYVPTADSGW
jgi:hypothetical protein